MTRTELLRYILDCLEPETYGISESNGEWHLRSARPMKLKAVKFFVHGRPRVELWENDETLLETVNETARTPAPKAR